MTLAPPDNLRGAVWMLASAVCFAGSGMAVKTVGPDLPVTVIAFFRALFGLGLIVPLFLRHGPVIFRTDRPGLHLLRLAGSTGSLLFGFYAITHLPLATAVSLSFTRPLFMIVIAVLFLGEIVRWRRSVATLVGFGGVLLMLGPTGLGFDWPALSALAAAASVSVALAVIRKHAATEGLMVFMAWFVVGSVILMAPMAAFFWKTPVGIQWAYLAFIGLASTTGQYCLIKSLSIAEATVVAPVDYSQIIIAATAGYFLFHETPTIWTAAGAVVIVVATLYILLREARLQQDAAPSAPTPPGT